ncbi:unnamed protein product [Leptidea sinapis]|uniref:Uncharacterized protein n=1 Tax=Leptidea sinapis TaxID=189913 RepID=A0A5E4QNV0_9NEOP|nr:unnamed protein product [Leptidea sinapis]
MGKLKSIQFNQKIDIPRGSNKEMSSANNIQCSSKIFGKSYKLQILYEDPTAVTVGVLGGIAIYGTAGLLTPVVASMLGFSSTGVVAGSTAAAAMSYTGNVAAGSILAKLTAAAMLLLCYSDRR